jgi:hypothetical protein
VSAQPEERLGIVQDDWEYLHDQIIEGVSSGWSGASPSESSRTTIRDFASACVSRFISLSRAGMDGAARSLLAGASMLEWLRSSRRRDRSATSHPSPGMPDSGIAPEELDVVRFRAPIAGWPPGTTGTVLFALKQGAVVEVDDDDVEVVWSSRGERVAAEA